MIDQGTSWSQIAQLVEEGGVRLDPGVAQRCAQHCSDFVALLEALQAEVRGLTRVEGMGTFPSGIALARKFSLKASGGSYSMDQALADHIAEVQRMRQVFERIEAMYAATDDAAARGITGVGSGS
ncbi:hypothetical protein ACFWPA_08695 [Rhodococcus sp. NPDC058505]|uniref:hypothetical protein n=1 Tax=unclassified Rhodococcus (in: high G+C Gram-positive bacteria) TaxID=192944 RepID=UPI0036496784